MPQITSESLIVDYLLRYFEAPTGEMSYKRISEATGVSIQTIWKRLTRLRDEGIVDWKDGSLATLRFLKPVERPTPVRPPTAKRRTHREDTQRPEGQCTVRGCTADRCGGQWCYEHELAFIERSRRHVSMPLRRGMS